MAICAEVGLPCEEVWFLGQRVEWHHYHIAVCLGHLHSFPALFGSSLVRGSRLDCLLSSAGSTPTETQLTDQLLTEPPEWIG